MKNRVVNPLGTANFELRRINSIHHYLSVEATQKLVLAFVMSRLDHCISLLYGCPQYLINRLRKFKAMLRASSWRFLKLTILRHTYKLYSGFQWMQEFSTKFALYASMLSIPLALSTLLTCLRFMHLLANSALLLTFVHCAFLHYTQKAMANVPCHTLHLLSGTIFPKLFETQNLLFLSNPP